MPGLCNYAFVLLNDNMALIKAQVDYKRLISDSGARFVQLWIRSVER